MHQDRKYQQTNEEDKIEAAIKDCQEWMGDEARFNKLVDYIKLCTTYEGASLGCAMAGIQFYPVQALLIRYNPNGREIIAKAIEESAKEEEDA